MIMIPIVFSFLNFHDWLGCRSMAIVHFEFNRIKPTENIKYLNKENKMFDLKITTKMSKFLKLHENVLLSEQTPKESSILINYDAGLIFI